MIQLSACLTIPHSPKSHSLKWARPVAASYSRSRF